MCSKIKDLYIVDRDASDSWYGFHYQAASSILFFLEEINMAISNGESINDLYLHIEYMEDFVIFKGDKVEKVFQAKKTLNDTIMYNVYADFLLEQSYLMINSKWLVVSNNKLDKLEFDKFKKIYKKLSEVLLKEFNLILKNIENREYLIENLKLRCSESELKNVRHLVRNIISRKTSNNYSRLNSEEFKLYLYDDIIKIIDNINDFFIDKNLEEFYKNIENIQILIKELNNKIDEEIIKLRTYVTTSEVKTNEDIRYALISLVYDKLEKRVNEECEYRVNYKDIEDEMKSISTNKHIWNKFLCIGRERLMEKITQICGKCTFNKCEGKSCIVDEVKILDFERALGNFNLDLSTNNTENNILEMCSDMVGKGRIVFFKKVLEEFKDNENIKLELSEKNDMVKFVLGENKIGVVSWLDNDEHYADLKKNAIFHINIYREFDEVLTKEYDEEIVFDNLGIYKSEYEEGFTFNNIETEESIFKTKVNFVSKKYLRS